MTELTKQTKCGVGEHEPHFDRSLCACGAMHCYCSRCGEQLDPCDEYECCGRCDHPDQPHHPCADRLNASGDPGWMEVHAELSALHTSKAADYGTDDDALANYVLTSAAVGEPDEYTCWLRIHEKCVRALNMIRSGRANECGEAVDVAALAIGAEALRRRRTG